MLQNAAKKWPVTVPVLVSPETKTELSLVIHSLYKILFTLYTILILLLPYWKVVYLEKNQKREDEPTKILEKPEKKPIKKEET